MKPVRWRVYITLLILASEIAALLGKPAKKSRKSGRRIFDTTPKLTRREWEELHKFEDALKNDNGELMFTNSWALKLDPAEIKVADRIAKKHGFINYGQVGKLEFFFILFCGCSKLWVQTSIISPGGIRLLGVDFVIKIPFLKLETVIMDFLRSFPVRCLALLRFLWNLRHILKIFISKAPCHL